MSSPLYLEVKASTFYLRGPRRFRPCLRFFESPGAGCPAPTRPPAVLRLRCRSAAAPLHHGHELPGTRLWNTDSRAGDTMVRRNSAATWPSTIACKTVSPVRELGAPASIVVSAVPLGGSSKRHSARWIVTVGPASTRSSTSAAAGPVLVMLTGAGKRFPPTDANSRSLPEALPFTLRTIAMAPLWHPPRDRRDLRRRPRHAPLGGPDSGDCLQFPVLF